MIARQELPARWIAALAALVLVGPVPGTFAASQNAPAQEATEPTALAGIAIPELPTNIINMIIVKVNGDPILLSDLQSKEDERVALLRQQLPDAEIQAQIEPLRLGILQGLIDESMMLQRADRLGITADANQVDRQIETLREQNNIRTEEEFSQALAALGMTLDQVRAQMRVSIRTQRLVYEEVNRNIFVSDKDIGVYYTAHLDDFAAPDQVRLQQLVFLTQGGDAAALRQQAEAALAELRQGEVFADVEAKYTNGMGFTDDGFIAVSDLNETLATNVPGLAPEVFSEVLESEFGFQIVRVLERQERSISAVEDVSEDIRRVLTTEKSQARLKEYLGGLRDNTDIEILDQRFAGIEDAWRKQPDVPVTGAR